jgi:hypothetical protein
MKEGTAQMWLTATKSKTTNSRSVKKLWMQAADELTNNFSAWARILELLHDLCGNWSLAFEEWLTKRSTSQFRESPRSSFCRTYIFFVSLGSCDNQLVWIKVRLFQPVQISTDKSSFTKRQLLKLCNWSWKIMFDVLLAVGLLVYS